MDRIYYITPTQYKALETLINEDDSDEKLTRPHAIAAKKMFIDKRTIEHHIAAIETQVNTTNKYKIARLFLEGNLIPIDKGKERERWQKIQILHRDL